VPGEFTMRINANNTMPFDSFIVDGATVVVIPDAVAVAPSLYRTR
jgi:hypothetical protein